MRTKRAPQNLLKTRHLHWPRRFSGFRSSRSAFRLFARFFAIRGRPARDHAAVGIVVTALAVFSFHRKG